MDVSFHASSIDSSSGTTPIDSQRPSAPTIFVCGYVAKRWHNSSLNTIITDLTPHYYLSCNGSNDFAPRTRQLLSHAECMLFFVNEYTLADVSCLLALQYAWQLMIPIIMLRPPRTKLVITARASSKLRRHIMVNSNGTVVRSPSVGNEISNGEMEHGILDQSGLDYALLQDILYEGYRIAVVYDRLDHGRSMDAVRSRITRATLPFHLTSSHGHSVIHFDGEDDDVDEMMTNGGQGIARSKRSTDKLSSSGSSGRLRRPATPGRTHPDHGKMQRCSQSKSPIPPRHRASESRHASSNLAADNSETLSMASSRLRLSQSTGSLADRQRTKPIPGPPKPIAPPPNLRPINGRGPRSPLAPIKVDHPSSGSLGSDAISPSINTTLSSPFDRRMSMMSLEDLTNYTHTQYLVFPIHDPTKKPQLIKFPNDLLEESLKTDSQWGSDSDIEEEVELAPRVNGDIGGLDEDDSPIASPAPYNDPIV
ncbi:hypothetical protein PRIPAC_92046 [Pristionchus pacificus]|uniref:Uncharacterized protein n=1 Tax=Pristionchus pacificus TaxID=54126 RepID=A0A2A6BPG1_PRIPA|nr:hypothetical protein PRIPAC_92046 [Pristionchus pacificus]|eukprot:PDM67673.1 hypothetical protein PRIPAC_45717 [Pristionchus pacificus]